MNREQKQLFRQEVCNSEFVSAESKEVLQELLRLVDVDDVCMGDPRAYAGGRVLVIVARPKDTLGLNMGDYSEGFYPPISSEFFIEVCIDEEYMGAIQISDSEGQPVGFLESIYDDEEGDDGEL